MKFLQKISDFVRKQKTAHIAVAIVVIMLFALQVERFVNQGTLLGYEVRNVSSTRRATSNELARKEGAEKRSRVCKAVSESYVSDLVKKEVVQSTFFPDKTKPELFSSCVYRTTDGSQTILSVSLRAYKSSKEAEDFIAKVGQQAEPQQFDGIEQAVYNRKMNQFLARNSNKVVIVNISKDLDQDIDIVSVATQIIKKLLNNQQ